MSTFQRRVTQPSSNRQPQLTTLLSRSRRVLGTAGMGRSGLPTADQ